MLKMKMFQSSWKLGCHVSYYGGRADFIVSTGTRIWSKDVGTSWCSGNSECCASPGPARNNTRASARAGMAKLPPPIHSAQQYSKTLASSTIRDNAVVPVTTAIINRAFNVIIRNSTTLMTNPAPPARKAKRMLVPDKIKKLWCLMKIFGQRIVLSRSGFSPEVRIEMTRRWTPNGSLRGPLNGSLNGPNLGTTNVHISGKRTVMNRKK